MQKQKNEISKFEISEINTIRAWGSEVVDAAISAVPYIGGSAVVLKNAPYKIWIEKQTIEMKKAINWLIDNVLDIKERLLEPEFLIDLQNIVNAHWLETNESRRKYLRNILINNVIDKTYNLPKLINGVKQVNEDEVLLLSFYINGYFGEVIGDHSGITGTYNLTQFKMVVDKKNLKQLSEDQILEGLNSLKNLNFLRNPASTTGMWGGTFRDDHFLTTSLGQLFIDYISNPK